MLYIKHHFKSSINWQIILMPRFLCFITLTSNSDFYKKKMSSWDINFLSSRTASLRKHIIGCFHLHPRLHLSVRRGRTLTFHNSDILLKWTHISTFDIITNQVSNILDRFVPPTRGAPWSYAEHHSQYYYRSDTTSPPLI